MCDSPAHEEMFTVELREREWRMVNNALEFLCNGNDGNFIPPADDSDNTKSFVFAIKQKISVTMLTTMDIREL